MKKLIYFLFLLLFISQSCKQNKRSTELTAEEKQMITDEIMDLTTNWINSNENMDIKKIIEFWDPSPDLMFAENGVFFPNRDSIYAYFCATVPQLKSLEAKCVHGHESVKQ